MSFAADCKKELCGLEADKPCCALSELCGLYMAIGSLILLGRGKVNVQFAGENMAVCRRVYSLLTREMSLSPQLHYVTSRRFGGRRKCVLTLGPVQSPVFLSRLNMLEQGDDGAERLRAMTPKLPITKNCCARAFLRGVLLGGGTMSSPRQGYHLELPYHDEDMRAMIAKCLQRLALPIRESSRREHGYFYFKQSEQMITLLTALGANQTVMHIEDLRVKRQVLGTVNRAMNCDASNLTRQMDASEKQLDVIRRLLQNNQLQTLPESLQEIARARLDAPDATLSELGQALSPPIGKSGVNHRLRRLMTLADTDKEE